MHRLTLPLLSLAILVIASGCAGPGDDRPTMTKDEAAAAGGKGDLGQDFCLLFDWYDDGICDTFCLRPDPDCGASGECRKTGCGGHVCADEDVITTCEARPEDACFQNASCERQAAGDCGFTMTAEVEACLDAINNPDPVVLSFAPTQCGTNPWQLDPQPTDGIHLGGELASIVAYYSSLGITIDEIGLINRAEPIAVCLACQCPRGDRLVVTARGASAQLLQDLGFSPLEGAVGTAPVQCGGNPWDAGAGATEHDRLVSWSRGLGADISELGSLVRTEPIATCAACQCPRGDFVIALPATDADSDILANNGFVEL